MRRAITPFNFPHPINLGKTGSAPAAGNIVVLKPARHLMVCSGIRRLWRSGAPSSQVSGASWP
jgi:acyl-CoA reductase-like NAD-dependent aldehyde dehydrogenase